MTKATTKSLILVIFSSTSMRIIYSNHIAFVANNHRNLYMAWDVYFCRIFSSCTFWLWKSRTNIFPSFCKLHYIVQKPLSLVFPTKTACHLKSLHAGGVRSLQAKTAGQVIDDTIRAQIYSQTDASIAPAPRKGPIRWSKALWISVLCINLWVSKWLLYHNRTL